MAEILEHQIIVLSGVHCHSAVQPVYTYTISFITDLCNSRDELNDISVLLVGRVQCCVECLLNLEMRFEFYF